MIPPFFCGLHWISCSQQSWQIQFNLLVDLSLISFPGVLISSIHSLAAIWLTVVTPSPAAKNPIFIKFVIPRRIRDVIYVGVSPGRPPHASWVVNWLRKQPGGYIHIRYTPTSLLPVLWAVTNICYLQSSTSAAAPLSSRSCWASLSKHDCFVVVTTPRVKLFSQPLFLSFFTCVFYLHPSCPTWTDQPVLGPQTEPEFTFFSKPGTGGAGLFPSCSSPHIKVSLDKTLDPKLAHCTSQQCLCVHVCKLVNLTIRIHPPDNQTTNENMVTGTCRATWVLRGRCSVVSSPFFPSLSPLLLPSYLSSLILPSWLIPQVRSVQRSVAYLSPWCNC